MCLQESRVTVEFIPIPPAEETLKVFCKPVALYNILHHRAQHDRTYLRRCLKYKINAKRKPRLARLEDEDIIFGYKDENGRIQRYQVTPFFTCSFCFLRCGSFRGLRLHLNASHDLFKFEFFNSDENKFIYVSVKTDILSSETSSEDELKPHQRPYYYFAKPRKRIPPIDFRERAKNIFPMKLDDASRLRYCAALGIKVENNTSSSCSLRELQNSIQHENEVSYATSVASNSIQSFDDTERSVTASFSPPSKMRKLPSDRSDSKSVCSANLMKRQFYHSHRAQPMVLDQVMADRDSEDEIDHDIASREDQRLLDDFVDVSKSEKHLMRLWNSFIKNQRVLADGHIPWACEAFANFYCKMLSQSTALTWCWRLFLVKQWNHGLLDAATMNKCSKIIQNFKDDKPGECSKTRQKCKDEKRDDDPDMEESKI